METGQGAASAWWQTAVRISFSPKDALTGVGPGSTGPALWFGVVTYVIGMLCYLPFSFGLQLLDPSLDAEGRVLLLVFAGGFLVTLPVWALFGLLLSAALYHPFLRLVGGQGDFNATLRALCYGVAPVALYVVPLFGWVIGGALTFVTSVYGQKYAHSISGPRVLLSWLIIMVVAVMLVALVALLAAAAVAAT